MTFHIICLDQDYKCFTRLTIRSSGTIYLANNALVELKFGGNNLKIFFWFVKLM